MGARPLVHRKSSGRGRSSEINDTIGSNNDYRLPMLAVGFSFVCRAAG